MTYTKEGNTYTIRNEKGAVLYVVTTQSKDMDQFLVRCGITRVERKGKFDARTEQACLVFRKALQSQMVRFSEAENDEISQHYGFQPPPYLKPYQERLEGMLVRLCLTREIVFEYLDDVSRYETVEEDPPGSGYVGPPPAYQEASWLAMILGDPNL